MRHPIIQLVCPACIKIFFIMGYADCGCPVCGKRGHWEYEGQDQEATEPHFEWED